MIGTSAIEYVILFFKVFYTPIINGSFLLAFVRLMTNPTSQIIPAIAAPASQLFPQPMAGRPQQGQGPTPSRYENPAPMAAALRRRIAISSIERRAAKR
jgi:hypothetical protein